MKTIEEAANHNYEQTDWSTYEDERIINAFKSGVEFVQRWIPVSEELPEANSEIIAKCNSYLELFIYEPLYTRNEDYLKFNFTHWRPIELK